MLWLIIYYYIIHVTTEKTSLSPSWYLEHTTHFLSRSPIFMSLFLLVNGFSCLSDALRNNYIKGTFIYITLYYAKDRHEQTKVRSDCQSYFHCPKAGLQLLSDWHVSRDLLTHVTWHEPESLSLSYVPLPLQPFFCWHTYIDYTVSCHQGFYKFHLLCLSSFAP